jgi:hypothetical protein
VLVLLIDFDKEYEDRYGQIRNIIAKEKLDDRVFVLGALSDPEKLMAALGMKLEIIGQRLADDCVENTRNLWGHELLRHNEPELVRMIELVKPFLFQ